jgi:NADPH-dependent ferric siderophore reductase
MTTLTLPRPHKVRHETRRRPVTVVRAEPLSPNFISVVFHGESLADFRSDGFDDHVKFIFENEAGEEQRRDYTPRRFDAHKRELTIEFLTHGHGDAGAWALKAQPGMKADIGGPKSSMVIPTEYPWHLLAGDETALPAIHRRLEEMPSGAAVEVLLKLRDDGDRRTFATKAQVSISYLPPDIGLADAIRSLRLPKNGFVWCAGESSVMAHVRDAVLEDHPHEYARIASYWKQDAPGEHAVLI